MLLSGSVNMVREDQKCEESVDVGAEVTINSIFPPSYAHTEYARGRTDAGLFISLGFPLSFFPEILAEPSTYVKWNLQGTDSSELEARVS